MQKVSGNKKTCVLAHKQERIAHFHSVGPARANFASAPQKGLSAAHAGTLTMGTWGCRCHGDMGTLWGKQADIGRELYDTGLRHHFSSQVGQDRV